MLIRSIVFNTLFYLNLIVQMLAAIPTMVMPRGAIVAVVRFWARTSLWLLRSICGTVVEFRGLERIPPGALMVASKHQSMWETFALFPLFADPAFILKRELMWIPFFGWFSWKAGMIPVNRGKRSQALLELSISARQELARGRQIVIMQRPGRCACRSRSIPGCSGRAGHSDAFPAPSSSRCSTRSRLVSPKRISARDCSTRSRPRPRG